MDADSPSQENPVVPPAADDALDARDLSWAVLLNQWVGLARSAVALGADEQSQALRKLVPDIIMLQAVTFALLDLQRLPLAEQQLGCLRAAWLIDRHEQIIRQHWPADHALPAQLEELITQARTACAKASPPPPEAPPEEEAPEG